MNTLVAMSNPTSGARTTSFGKMNATDLTSPRFLRPNYLPRLPAFPRERGIGPATRMVDELDSGTTVALGQVRWEDNSPVAGVMIWEFAKSGSSRGGELL